MPRVQLYHGSDQARTEFISQPSQRFTMGRSYEVSSPASFFTPDADFARSFGPVLTVVEIGNAKLLDLTEGAWGVGDAAVYAILEARFGEEVGMLDPAELWAILDDPEDAQAIAALGFQAVAFRERDSSGEAHDTYGVIDRSVIEVVDHQLEPERPKP